jgi:hypothetical protein
VGIGDLQREIARLWKERERRGDLLEAVVNELDLSDAAIAEHGSLGTEPHLLVRMVLAEKDRVIRNLKAGLTPIHPNSEEETRVT